MPKGKKNKIKKKFLFFFICILLDTILKNGSFLTPIKDKKFNSFNLKSLLNKDKSQEKKKVSETDFLYQSNKLKKNLFNIYINIYNRLSKSG